MTWTPDTVPDSFWHVIATADRDRQKLSLALNEMSRTELYDFYILYDRLAGILRDPPYAAEDASEDAAEDIAKWAVAQGKRYYFELLANPAQTPHRLPNKQGIGFVSTIFTVYGDRFGEELSEVHAIEPWSEP